MERRDAARQGSRGRKDSRRHPEPGLAAEAAELELAQVPRARRRSHGSRRGRIWPLLQGRGRGRGPPPWTLRREDDGGRPELEPRGAPARTRRGLSWPPPRPLLDLAAPGLGRSARWPPGATRSPRGHGRGRRAEPAAHQRGGVAGHAMGGAAAMDPPPRREGGREASGGVDKERQRAGEGGETDEGKEKKGRIKERKKEKEKKMRC